MGGLTPAEEFTRIPSSATLRSHLLAFRFDAQPVGLGADPSSITPLIFCAFETASCAGSRAWRSVRCRRQIPTLSLTRHYRFIIPRNTSGLRKKQGRTRRQSNNNKRCLAGENVNVLLILND